MKHYFYSFKMWLYHLIVSNITFHEFGFRIYVLSLASRKIIKNDYFMTIIDQSIRDMRADEPRAAGYKCFCHASFSFSLIIVSINFTGLPFLLPNQARVFTSFGRHLPP